MILVIFAKEIDRGLQWSNTETELQTKLESFKLVASLSLQILKLLFEQSQLYEIQQRHPPHSNKRNPTMNVSAKFSYMSNFAAFSLFSSSLSKRV